MDALDLNVEQRAGSTVSPQSLRNDPPVAPCSMLDGEEAVAEGRIIRMRRERGNWSEVERTAADARVDERGQPGIRLVQPAAASCRWSR